MSIREITDRNGVNWRIWAVTPDVIHPITAAEAFMEDLQDGWLCFESPNERRRLALYPRDWADIDAANLEALLEAAAVVRPSRKSGDHPAQHPAPQPVPQRANRRADGQG